MWTPLLMKAVYDPPLGTRCLGFCVALRSLSVVCFALRCACLAWHLPCLALPGTCLAKPCQASLFVGFAVVVFVFAAAAVQSLRFASPFSSPAGSGQPYIILATKWQWQKGRETGLLVISTRVD